MTLKTNRANARRRVGVPMMALQPNLRRVVATLAPYFPGLLTRQSDFGHPVGTGLGDVIVSNFSQNLACDANRSAALPRGGFIRVVAKHME
ncbi:MAG: hypothetical protein WBF03_21665 [Xanthobacteraceae bacterium]